MRQNAETTNLAINRTEALMDAEEEKSVVVANGN
jgi:hypothetical protein